MNAFMWFGLACLLGAISVIFWIMWLLRRSW